MQYVRYNEHGNVAVITYDRTDKRNAWNTDMYRQIVSAVERANESEKVGAMVITNAGDVFSAGVDFKAPPEPKDATTGIRPNVATLGMAADTSWLHLLARSKPSVMAINGSAIGLGVTHTLAADIRVGGVSSSYRFAFLARGTMPEYGCTALLPRLVGYGRALDLVLSAADLDAQEAERMGLITRILPDNELVAGAIALAGRIAEFPAVQVAQTRAMFQENATATDLNTLLKVERDAFVSVFGGRPGISN